MSKQIATFNSDNGKCQGQILTDSNQWVFTIQGVCKNVTGNTVKYMAAAPPDLRQSYMGSGLPFGNEEIAYEGSPNKGEATINGSNFSFTVISPNAYYKDNGSTLVKPHVHFTVGQDYFDVALGVGHIANRSLTNLPGRPNRSTGR